MATTPHTRSDEAGAPDLDGAAQRAYVAQFPYAVGLYRDWYDHDGRHVGFTDEAEARRFAVLRPEPLVDLVARGRGVIAARRLLPHPASSGMSPARDDFPQEA